VDHAHAVSAERATSCSSPYCSWTPPTCCSPAAAMWWNPTVSHWMSSRAPSTRPTRGQRSTRVGSRPRHVAVELRPRAMRCLALHLPFLCVLQPREDGVSVTDSAAASLTTATASHERSGGEKGRSVACTCIGAALHGAHAHGRMSAVAESIPREPRIDRVRRLLSTCKPANWKPCSPTPRCAASRP
jgi:hypothetical protein